MPSPNDQAVLSIILNPLNPALPLSGGSVDHLTDSGDALINKDALDKVKMLERNGVLAAEAGNLDDSLKFFTDAIKLLPNRPSAYNNRAQALRLLGRNEEAMEDLNCAITLSDGQGRSGVNALCQRSLLLLLKGRESEAMSDLEAASRQGHEFAKSMLVKLNPYSALCNQMLKEMMSKLNGMK